MKDLIGKQVKSCGCLKSIISSQKAKLRVGENHPSFKHGKSKSKEYLTKIKRNSYLKTKFGITNKEYDEMLYKQNGVCEICNQKETSVFKNTTRRLCVDHNHNSGKVRSLLCQRCNRVLGIVKENRVLLNKLISYLEKNDD